MISVSGGAKRKRRQKHAASPGEGGVASSASSCRRRKRMNSTLPSSSEGRKNRGVARPKTLQEGKKEEKREEAPGLGRYPRREKEECKRNESWLAEKTQ